MIALLTCLALVLAIFGLRDLIRAYGRQLDVLIRRATGARVRWAGKSKTIAEIFDLFGTAPRLRRAGLEFALSPSRLMFLKTLSCSFGVAVGIAMICLMSGGRLVVAVALTIPIACFMGPDAALEWIARRRSRRIERSLSDALDLAANAIGSGEDPLSALSVSSRRAGPLGIELGVLSVERRCGLTRRDVLEGFRERVPIPEVATLSATIERSARFGSPVSDRFRHQAEELRRSEMRRISEQAARSSPRIQLVVALLLVPSVLLMIAAGLLSNLGSFLSGF